MTDSTVASSPTSAWSRARSPAWSVPGRVRMSTSASPAPGMTLTFFPAWRTVGVTVSRSIASIDRRRTGSATRSSSAALAPAGSALGQVGDGSQPERAEEVTDDLDHARRPLGLVGRQGRDGPSEPDGGVGVVRHRAVAGRAGRAQPRPCDPLLRDLDRVEPPAAQRDRVATDLVERRGGGASGGVAEQLGPLLDEAACPVLATGLLVGDRGEDHVSAEVGAGTARARASPPAPSRPCSSCRSLRGPRRRRRSAPRRTGRASRPPRRRERRRCGRGARAGARWPDRTQRGAPRTSRGRVSAR